MQASAITSSLNTITRKSDIPYYHGHPDYDFAAAVSKVSPKAQAKAKATAQDFEATFINSMFDQMTKGLQGEGPYGSTTGTGIWRSMLTEQYSKSFAKAGGVGIAKDVYRSLILKQAHQVGQVQEKHA